MNPTKPFQFHGTAGDSFIYTIVSVLLVYIPVVGVGLSFNYTNKWIAERSTVNGMPVVYSAGLGESTWFIWKNLLLTIITLGIYVFWFIPKQYSYVADHLTLAAAAPVVAQPTVMQQPVAQQPTIVQ
jgi:uncharacterized membrane protein YjgN (DUF898 family)